MSRSCEFCSGDIHELTRTRNHVWIGCRRCQRSWREELDAASVASGEPAHPMAASVSFQESTFGPYVTAAAAVAVAFAVRWALRPLIGNAKPVLVIHACRYGRGVVRRSWPGTGSDNCRRTSRQSLLPPDVRGAKSSELPYERLSSISMNSGRTKVWATRLIAPKATSIGTDPVKCRARLGGLLKLYYREAV